MRTLTRNGLRALLRFIEAFQGGVRKSGSNFISSRYFLGEFGNEWDNLGWYPPGNYLFVVTNKNTRRRREICSKLTIKTSERRLRSGLFVVNFEYISPLVLVFLLLTLSR